MHQRVVADDKDKRSYLGSTLSPNVFWLDLVRVNFSNGAPVRKLDPEIDMAAIHSGECSAAFKTAQPFTFEPAP